MSGRYPVLRGHPVLGGCPLLGWCPDSEIPMVGVCPRVSESVQRILNVKQIFLF